LFCLSARYLGRPQIGWGPSFRHTSSILGERPAITDFRERLTIGHRQYICRDARSSQFGVSTSTLPKALKLVRRCKRLATRQLKSRPSTIETMAGLTDYARSSITIADPMHPHRH